MKQDGARAKESGKGREYRQGQGYWYRGEDESCSRWAVQEGDEWRLATEGQGEQQANDARTVMRPA